MAEPLIRSGYVDCGPVRVHHTHGGRGTPVLLVHGLGSSGYIEWRHNLRALAGDHRVYAPDLPGFGRSDKPRARYGVPYFVRTLARYLADRGLRSAAVVGTSLGGRIALELTLRHPDLVSRLVLVNALGLGRPTLQPYYPLMAMPRVGEAVMRLASRGIQVASPAMIRRVAARYTGSTADLDRTMDDAYLQDLREMYAAEGFLDAYLATVRSLITPAAMAGAHDLTGRLGEIRQPVLLVWGSRDPLFPVEHATRAHRLLADARLAVIEGAGHTPQAERPEEFNRVVGRFLAGT